MSFAANYLNRYAHHHSGIISEPPHGETELIVIIPCYKEDKLFVTLESLTRCYMPPANVEVIILINYPQYNETAQFHQRLFDQAQAWSKLNSSSKLRFFPLILGLPEREAGVGLARKILMDEAIIRFHTLNKPHGIIVSLDADCQCEANYLTEIFHFFYHNPMASTCSIYFEHPLEGDEFDKSTYEAIAIYELYLRYYVEGLRYAGFPFAFHTIGSAFAVKAYAYASQGGMNKRKAGEDFYFLNKMMLLGGYGEINSTCVYPSPRLSDRVPFGTGAAINKIVAGSQEYLYTWNPAVFDILKKFFEALPMLYTSSQSGKAMLHPLLFHFLEQNNWTEMLSRARKNASSEKSFIKRIFHGFDGLKVLQFIRYAHEHHLQKVHLTQACGGLLYKRGIVSTASDIASILNIYRKMQREHSHWLHWK